MPSRPAWLLKLLQDCGLTYREYRQGIRKLAEEREARRAAEAAAVVTETPLKDPIE